MLDLDSNKKDDQKNEHDSDILQAEIGALLFNMGKTCVDFWKKRNYFPNANNYFNEFSSYRDYYLKDYFYDELYKVSPKLKKIFSNLKINTPDKIFKNEDQEGINIIDELMKASENNEETSEKIISIKSIFFRGCENINSGIDKGSPKESEKIKNKLFIANAFGTFKEEVFLENLDKKRQIFWQGLHEFLEKNDYYNNPDWKCIRNQIFKEIEAWYSSILSDTRFPINDVTLWDQVYMTATMFKAVLADMFLIMKDTEKQQKIISYYENPNSIKWRIMGIQYDKLGLAEKGFKPAQIIWYRETAREIDNKIKSLLELEYCLGNEIYRDETGIYFLVGENVSKEEKLNTSLKEDILCIFNVKTKKEFCPAIFITEPSRGLMNLTYLLEEAKNNFLQTNYSKDFFHFDGIGKSTICPVCQKRAFSPSDKQEAEDKFICDVCNKDKTKNRLEEWLKNTTKETIWTSELQDKNGRIALITLKFELKEWLNGNLLNSLLIQEEDYNKRLEQMETFFRTFLSREPILNRYYSDKEKRDTILDEGKKDTIYDEVRSYTITLLSCDKVSFDEKKDCQDLIRRLDEIQRIGKIVEKLRENIFKTDSIQLNTKFSMGKKYNNKNFEQIVKKFYDDLSRLSESIDAFKEKLPNYKGYLIEEDFKKFYSSLEKFIKHIKELQKGSFFLTKLASDSYGGCINNNETFDDWIRQVFFGSITGSSWETFIKNSSLNNFIDWDSQRIYWGKWTIQEIKLFTRLLLQFLLRKNPSPARLRRIWVTTETFFRNIDVIKMAGIQESRCKRLVWNNRNDIADGEYQDGNLLFQANSGNIYLINPMEQIPKGKKAFVLKPYEQQDSKEKPVVELSIDEATTQNYKPYFSIIDPTPISWQFVIPAEYVPNLIKNITDYYNEKFTWVYGKLPLHIGVVIQDYKKPLYLGIKALRKIRRDNIEEKFFKREIKAINIKSVLNKFAKEIEKENNTGKYYSLYETTDTKGDYQFYLRPQDEELKRIKPLSEICNSEKINYYPNTFDFEFLDTNVRRNEIFYVQGQRKLSQKKNRPYTLEETEKLLRLKSFFTAKTKDNNELEAEKSVTQMHNFITQLYSKYDSWNIENDDRNIESFKLFFTTLLINTFKLNTAENELLKRDIAEILEISDIKDLQKKSSDEIRWIVRLFFDSYEFWHKALKEV